MNVTSLDDGGCKQGAERQAQSSIESQQWCSHDTENTSLPFKCDAKKKESRLDILQECKAYNIFLIMSHFIESFRCLEIIRA